MTAHTTTQGAINYDGRAFRKAGGGDGVISRYQQKDDLVWAEFTGGPVRRGSINGVCDPDGVLHLAYTLVLEDGAVISGHTVNSPVRDPEGRLMLRENWQRFGPHAATGTSYLEEVD